jgi:hypothetical protein
VDDPAAAAPLEGAVPGIPRPLHPTQGPARDTLRAH